MKLPGVKDLKVANKKILLRTNYDVPLTVDGRVADETRIEESLLTIKYLLSQKAKIIIITHLDRPGGKTVPGLRLKPVVHKLLEILANEKIEYSKEILGEKTKRMVTTLNPGEILMLENLRFNSGEETNDLNFAKSIAGLADFFINDAFAVSHRQHASIVGVPQFLPSVLGFDFLEEIEILSKIREKPKRPVVVILGGVKKSKLKAARRLVSWADFILVGGRLIEYNGIPFLIDHQKVLGSLIRNKEDITMKTIENFSKVIAKAKTIVWSGPMGAVEEKKYEKGTKTIAEAVVKSRAYTIIGGGDTEAALTRFGLVDKVDYISSGGGAMLTFLADGTLPGIEAVKES